MRYLAAATMRRGRPDGPHQDLVLADVEVSGRRCDVLVVGGRVARLGRVRPDPGAAVVDGHGGALIRGLTDHHAHLLALAARRHSVECGPPSVRTAAQFRERLRRADDALPAGRWLRGVGFDEHVLGPVDRDTLDLVVPGRPVRIQHRSGLAWVLNSRGLRAVGLDDRGPAEQPVRASRDPAGRYTGWIHGRDADLHSRTWAPPDLTEVGRSLARYGITSVTDATVHNGPDELAVFCRATRTGALPQRVEVMGGHDLPVPTSPRVVRGHLKIVLGEQDLPAPARLGSDIAQAHRDGRGVAVHCASHEALVVALAGLRASGQPPAAVTPAGPRRVPRDRIEHASVVRAEMVPMLREAGVAVVVQPHFVAMHGDRYRETVAAEDLAGLHRCRTFLTEGIPVYCGTDAPFGDPDPWLAMRAAVRRRTPRGEVLGPAERVSPARAVRLFAGFGRSGAAPIRPGTVADLVVLDRPWREALEDLSADLVRATVCQGRVAHGPVGRA